MKRSVLFICTHNSARSQMAEALLRERHGDRHEAFSAGLEATRVHPAAVKAMDEIGIDISGQRSKAIHEYKYREFDLVVTVCDGARMGCPFFPGKENMHKGFEDPAAVEGGEEEALEAFRRSRDEILSWIDSMFG